MQSTAGHAAVRALRSLTSFSQPEPADDVQVSRPVLARQILEQTVALTDHLEQAAARRVVLLVRLEVFGQLVDALGQDRDLHFRRPRVLLVRLEIRNDLRLLGGRDRHYPNLLDTG